jgi:AcrR family transcriptional regulator
MSNNVNSRRAREKEEKRTLIIETATRLFREQGFEKVSLRNIADAMEYSPTMIYLYFKDKNELLHALHAEGFQMFRRRLQQAMQGIPSAWGRLEELGRTYIAFGIENPEYYELMFISGSPLQTEKSGVAWEEGLLSHACLEGEIKNCMEAGYFKGHEYRSLSFMIWCFVHGLVSLVIKNRMRMYEESERGYIIQQAQHTFNSYLAKL